MLILDKFFLKYEGGRGVKLTPAPGKTALKKPILIRVNISGSAGSPRFIFWVSTSQITWINKSMTPTYKQIGPNKRPAYRTKRDFVSCIYSY